jgi:hypothetical protein
MRALLLLQLARRVPLQRQICIVLNKQQLTPQRVHRTLNPYLVHISMAIGMHHRLICKRSAQRQQTWYWSHTNLITGISAIAGIKELNHENL